MMRIAMRRYGWLVICSILLLPQGATAGSDEDPRTAPHLKVAKPGVPRAVLPTGGAGVQPVYFFPQDNDANATVVNLFNSNPDPVTVQVRGFDSKGTLNFNQSVDLPAGKTIRLVSDTVVAAPPPSWANTTDASGPVTNVVVTNFTDFVFVAELLLPNGVKVDGYIEWNPGTGTVDPRAAAARLPLRFSVGGDAP
jgi:hypothetical protein